MHVLLLDFWKHLVPLFVYWHLHFLLFLKIIIFWLRELLKKLKAFMLRQEKMSFSLTQMILGMVTTRYFVWCIMILTLEQHLSGDEGALEDGAPTKWNYCKHTQGQIKASVLLFPDRYRGHYRFTILVDNSWRENGPLSLFCFWPLLSSLLIYHHTNDVNWSEIS